VLAILPVFAAFRWAQRRSGWVVPGT